MITARLLVPLFALGLAGCGQKSEAGPERKTAAGEVLGGSITDDMLPLDTLRSQPPPLRETVQEPVAAERATGSAGLTRAPAAGASEPAAAPAGAATTEARDPG